MITLRSFSLVMSIVCLRHLACTAASDQQLEGLGAEQAGLNLPWVIAACVLFSVAGKALALTAALRVPSVSPSLAWHEFERRRSRLEWLWLVAQGWWLPASGLTAWLAQAERSGWWSALMITVWFAPSLIFLAAMELSAAQLECMWSSTRSNSKRLVNQAELNSSSVSQRWCYRARLGAIGSLLSCLAPVVVLLAVLDSLNRLLPHSSEGLRGAMALLALLSVGLTFAPLWMQLLSGARRLGPSDELAARVVELCKQLKMRGPIVCTVGGTQAWHGAALVGWTPMFQQLWVGNTLPKQLTDEQLDMVLLHELAHMRRQHCWWRLLPLVACGVLAALMMTSSSIQTLAVDATSNAWPSWLLLGVLSLAMVWLLGWISRTCELDADRHACQVAERFCTWAAERPGRAMSELFGALRILNGRGNDEVHATWLHPSLSQRMAALGAQSGS